jgi:hypothetical protein
MNVIYIKYMKYNVIYKIFLLNCYLNSYSTNSEKEDSSEEKFSSEMIENTYISLGRNKNKTKNKTSRYRFSIDTHIKRIEMYREKANETAKKILKDTNKEIEEHREIPEKIKSIILNNENLEDLSIKTILKDLMYLELYKPYITNFNIVKNLAQHKRNLENIEGKMKLLYTNKSKRYINVRTMINLLRRKKVGEAAIDNNIKKYEKDSEKRKKIIGINENLQREKLYEVHEDICFSRNLTGEKFDWFAQ